MEKPVSIKQQKNIMQIFSGVSLIILTFIANGFLSFIVVGFDFSNLWTTEFWANFGILFTSEMCVLFGMFILQRMKDLQNKKITDLQEHIDNQRNIVYGVDKITDAEKWLKEIFNYREKLFLFENKIKSLHSKIILIEPKKDCKNYDKKLKKYEKLKKLKQYYVDQFEFIKHDKERLELIVQKNLNESQLERIAELQKELSSDEYAFTTARIHYKEVYWGNLLSDVDEVKSKASTPFFSERKELSKNIVKYLAMGIITTSFVTALIFPTIKSLSWETVMSLILNAITLIFFMARGVVVSNQIILGTYYRALEKRKSIYNQMLKDLGISKIVIKKE
jgi:hypothetical protein